MTRYYKIALRTNFARYKKTKFINILEKKYPKLYEREMEYLWRKSKFFDRLNFTSDSQEENFIKETKEMYKRESAPEYIIVEKSCGKTYEYWTEKPVDVCSVILNKHEISNEEAYDYILDNPDYKDAAEYIFSKKKENILQKPIQLVKRYMPTRRV